MREFVEAVARTLVTEWRYTFLSARREWPTSTAARKAAHELRKGLRLTDLRCYAAEIRAARR